MPSLLSVLASGLLIDRPAAGPDNRSYYFWASDVDGGTLYQSTGSAWQKLARGATESGGAGGGALVALDEVVLVSGSASIVFGSISGAYRDLQIHWHVRGDGSYTMDGLDMTFNGDTAGNYEYEESFMQGGTNIALSSGAQDFARIGPCLGASAAADLPSVGRATIYLYAGTTFEKVYRAESYAGFHTGSSDGSLVMDGGTWHSTDAVTDITIVPHAGGDFVAGSVATLYGIAGP